MLRAAGCDWEALQVAMAMAVAVVVAVAVAVVLLLVYGATMVQFRFSCGRIAWGITS